MPAPSQTSVLSFLCVCWDVRPFRISVLSSLYIYFLALFQVSVLPMFFNLSPSWVVTHAFRSL